MKFRIDNIKVKTKSQEELKDKLNAIFRQGNTLNPIPTTFTTISGSSRTVTLLKETQVIATYTAQYQINIPMAVNCVFRINGDSTGFPALFINRSDPDSGTEQVTVCRQGTRTLSPGTYTFTLAAEASSAASSVIFDPNYKIEV